MTFLTVLRRSPVYGPEWVSRINRDAARFLKPDRIVCISDVPVDCERIDLTEPWPGWWSKVVAFRPGLFSGPVVFMDLDSLILAPIPHLRDKLPVSGELFLLDDFFTPARPASGVVMFNPSPEASRIYADFLRDPVAAMRTRHGDGGWIGGYPHRRLQRIFPAAFASYKAHKLQNTHAGFPVVCFHGKPKQNDFPPGHWATKAWLGPNSPGVEPRER